MAVILSQPKCVKNDYKICNMNQQRIWEMGP